MTIKASDFLEPDEIKRVKYIKQLFGGRVTAVHDNPSGKTLRKGMYEKKEV